MILNYDIVGIEKINGMCSSTFVLGEFSGLFLHSFIFNSSFLHSLNIEDMH